MPRECKELKCRDVGVDCDFVARGDSVQEVIETCAAHGAENHGMKSFPPEMWVQMRSKVQTVRV